MKQYTGHNEWLNQRPNETNEEYNRRIGEWEEKEANKQYGKVATYEFLIEILKAQLKWDDKRREHKPDINPDWCDGYRMGIKSVIMRLEFLKDASEIIGNDPTRYELRWEGGDDYKLGERK